MKSTNLNVNTLLACFFSSALTACGGGGIGSFAASSGPSAIAASAGDQLLVAPHSHTTPLAQIDYQNIRALIGTGIGATLSPTDLRTHYSLPGTLTGAGQTIAIVDAPGAINPTGVAADLNAFSTYYKLPLCNASNPCFKQIDLSNGVKVAATDSWKYEVSLDVQWAHAMAPAASIVLVTARTAGMADMLVAVQTAAAQPNVVAISMSWGAYEFSTETSAAYDGVLKNIQASGIILLASSGDSGNNGSNQSWPAASPYATSVGGSSIKTVGYALPTVATEVAWSLGGGGASLYEAMPGYQTTALAGTAILTMDKTKRAIPDIAYNADPTYSPVGVIVGGSWYAEGGTSAGAPQWAAITALLAQQRVNKKESSLPILVKSSANGFNGIIYQAKLDAASFFDVTSGNDNTAAKACALCSAGKGYDAVTGLGVPNVNNMLAFF